MDTGSVRRTSSSTVTTSAIARSTPSSSTKPCPPRGRSSPTSARCVGPMSADGSRRRPTSSGRAAARSTGGRP